MPTLTGSLDDVPDGPPTECLEAAEGDPNPSPNPTSYPSSNPYPSPGPNPDPDPNPFPNPNQAAEGECGPLKGTCMPGGAPCCSAGGFCGTYAAHYLLPTTHYSLLSSLLISTSRLPRTLRFTQCRIAPA